MKYINNISSFIIFGIISIILLPSCKREEKANSSSISVSTSIEPLAELVRLITDSTVSVNSLLPEGYSAESYEPSAKDLKKISSANIYFAIGDLGFEASRLEKLRNINPNVKFVKLSENFCHEHGSPSDDPHIWTSPRGIESLAHGITKHLAEIDTIHRDLYFSRFENLHKTLDSISSSIRIKLMNSQVKGFVIYHPSLSDYAEEFGLTQLCIEHQGKDPNPKQLSELVDRAKALNVKVVFVQKEFNSRLSSTIANEIGAKIFEINPLGKNPIEEIENISNSLVNSQ